MQVIQQLLCLRLSQWHQLGGGGHLVFQPGPAQPQRGGIKLESPVLRGKGEQHDETDLLLQHLWHVNAQVLQHPSQGFAHGTVGQAQLAGLATGQRQVIQRLPTSIAISLHSQPQQWQIGLRLSMQQLQLQPIRHLICLVYPATVDGVLKPLREGVATHWQADTAQLQQTQQGIVSGRDGAHDHGHRLRIPA